MVFEVVNDKLEINGRAAAFVRANSFGGRFHPTLIICHDTADRPFVAAQSGPSQRDTVNYFASKECKVSAHVVVDRDGTITQMVPFDCKAYHAGKSVWDGQSLCNNFAIGIEIDNPGALDKNGRAWFSKKGEPGIEGIQRVKTKEHGDAYWLGYTPAQIAAVTELCRALVEKYPTINEIATHWLISPGRKVDTNPLFPLDELREAVFPKAKAPIGRPMAFPELKLGDTGDKVKAVQDKLCALGYQVGVCDGQFGPQMRVAVLALEAENDWPYDAILTPNEHKLLMTDPATKAMPVGARAEWTAKDLKAAGSHTVWYTTWVKRGCRFLGLAGITGLGDETANGGANVNAVLDQLDTAQASVGRVSSTLAWGLTVKGLVVIGVVATFALIYFVADRIEKRRVKAAQTVS